MPTPDPADAHAIDKLPAPDGIPGQANGSVPPDALTADRDTGAAGTVGDDDRSLQAFWEVVKRLPGYLRLAAALARDPRVPRRSKGILLVAGAYTVSPIDLVPGVIPVAGQVDDLYVLLTGLQQAIRSAPHGVVEEHLERTGVDRADIDADLATIRRLVRRGLVWTLRTGGRAAMSMGRNVTSFINGKRKKGE